MTSSKDSVEDETRASHRPDITSPDPHAQPETPCAPAVMVVVYCDGEVLFALDESGRTAIPATMPERASVALALARAAGALAVQPIQDGYRQNLCAAADRLTAINTPASRDALAILATTTRHQAEAFEAALTLIEASVH